MDYFRKIEKIDNDLSWNIPETAKGSLNLVGGNISHFNTEIKIAEFLEKNYPLKSLNLVLPDSLKKTLPDLPNFIFLPSTDSGSFSSRPRRHPKLRRLQSLAWRFFQKHHHQNRYKKRLRNFRKTSAFNS